MRVEREWSTKIVTRWPEATAMRFSSDQAMALGYDGAPTRTAAWKRDFELWFWIWELEMEGKKDMARVESTQRRARRCLLLAHRLTEP